MSTVMPNVASPRLPNDRPWIAHYPACVPAELDYPQEPAWWILAKSASEHPERTAICYYKQRLTYQETSLAARRTARMLIDLGIKPGDRVGLLLPNVPEYITALNGIWMAGGIAVALSPLMIGREVSDLLELTECRTVITLDLLLPLVRENDDLTDHILLTTLQDRLPHWQRLGYAFARLRRIGLSTTDSPKIRWMEKTTDLASDDETNGAADESFEPIRPDSLDDPAYILPTGGTTGSPKAVTLSHRNLVANAWQLHHWSGTSAGRETILCVLPFFHSYGLSTCVMTGLASAATLVLHHRFIPRRVLQLIAEHRPTVFPAVPAMLVALNEILRSRPADLTSLRHCLCGGAPLDPHVATEFATFSQADVVEGFGLSEASPVTHAGPLNFTARPGTIGLPLPDTDARIVDSETGRHTLPPGEIGELVIRGPQVMLGYWNNPEATAHAIRDGWLHTGDLGTRDEDGFFRIVDRKKDLIITSGFNVYPGDVEPVLRQFQGILDAAVVGVPDTERGEIVKAVIAMESGAELDRKSFDKFCRENLAKHKCPKIVEVLAGDLPRNFLGKVLRRELRELAVEPPEPSLLPAESAI